MIEPRSTRGSRGRKRPEQGNADSKTLSHLSLLLFDQQQRWQRGECPRAETYFDEHPSLRQQPEDALTLLYHELVLRERRGERPSAAEYEQRFPQWAEAIRQQFEIHVALSLPIRPAEPAEPTLPPPPPGYEIEGVLGRGGSAVVYRARQLDLDRPVALKMILGGEEARAEDRARFRDEAHAVARLQHANIVQIYEVIEDEGRLFIALELINGGSLSRRVGGQPLPPRHAAQLVEQLALAVHFVHQQGLIHRDLKPANVLLQVENANAPTAPNQSASASLHSAIPKITDFGLAKWLDDGSGRTRTGEILGTPSYMAPEQIQGPRERIGPAADVYGLGAILYELLTGRPPFLGDTALATLQQVQETEPVSITRLQPACPRDIDTIALKCLHKEPARRYANARALADDLYRFLDGRPIAARPVGRAEQLAKWARRRPAVATLLISLIAVTLLGLAGVASQWRRADLERDDAIHARNLEAAARADAEARLYASQIAQAHLSWRAARNLEAEAILDACRARSPELCHWEWHFLKRQCHSQVFTLAGHTQTVTSLAFSPDGRWLASSGGYWNGTDPGEVKLWDARTGQLVHNLRGPAMSVARVAFDPEAKLLVAACLDRKVWRWQLAGPGPGPEPLTPLDIPGAVNGVAFHPAGRHLACGDSTGVVQVWDLDGDRLRGSWRNHGNNIFDVAYSPDGTLLASVDRDGVVIVRDADNGRIKHRLRNTNDARRIAFSPDGRLLVATSHEGTVRVWDMQREATVVTALLGFTFAGANNLAFSPDGRRVALCAFSPAVRVLNVRGHVEDLPIDTGAARAQSVAFSPDSRLVAVALEGHVIRVWDLQQPREPRALITGPTWTGGLAINPSGDTLALAGSRNWSINQGAPNLRLVDFPSGKLKVELKGHKDWLTSVAWRGDGNQLVAGDRAGAVIVWDPQARKAERTLVHGAPVLAVAYHPDGATAASAGADGKVQLWNAHQGAPSGTLEHAAAVRGLAYSDDGTYLATATADRLVHVWSAASQQKLHVLRGHHAGASAVAFRPGSHLLVSADEEQSPRFWDADTGADLTSSTTSFLDRLVREDIDGAPASSGRRNAALAFTPDGRRLVVVGPERPMQVWDVPSRQPILNLSEVEPSSAVFSRDGRQLLVGSRDVLRVWDAALPDLTTREKSAQQRSSSWHRAAAQAALNERHWFAADFHAGRVLEDDPFAGFWYTRRGLARAALGRHAQAEADHVLALALGVDDVTAWAARGHACVYLGRWDEADEAFAAALKRNENNVNVWYLRAAARLAAGNRAGHEALCRSMLARFGATKAPATATQLLYALAPLAAPLDAKQLHRLGTLAAPASSVAQRTLTSACYRAGRYQEAIQNYPLPVQRGSRAKAWDMLFRAMAHQRLDEGAAAESWLAAACHWIEEAELVEFTPLSSGAAPWVTWYERVEVQSLLEEAGNLITAPALQPRVQALLAAMRQVRIGAPSARVSETRAAP